ALLGAAAGVGAVGLVAILGGGRTPKRARALGAAVAMALVVLGGVLVGAVPTLRSRALSSLERQASTARAVLWSDALALLEQHPRGVGLGACPEVVRAIEDDTPSDVFIPPHHYAHNVLLTAWAEAGPLGLAATAWAWGLLVVLGASAVLGRGRAIAR